MTAPRGQKARRSRAQLYGTDGFIGWIDPTDQGSDQSEVIVRLENGAVLRAPAEKITQKADGSYYLSISKDQALSAVNGENRLVIPVIEEQVDVSKKTAVRGKVRIEKNVTQHEETVEIPVLQEQVHVERVPLNQVVHTPPPVRTEGDTLIIPVLEEQLVVEKRLVLKEEIHVTRTQHQVSESEKVTLRKEEVNIKRTGKGAK